MELTRARFRRLIEPVHDGALAFARSLCRSSADGDDLFQEALVRALAKLDGLRDDAAFRPWFYRVLVSVHRNRCRRPWWRRLVPFADREHDRASGDRTDEAVAGAQRARLALAELPAEQREALVLFELEGWTVEEIAELHAVSVSAIKSRLARGRDRLRAIYVERFAVDLTPRPSLVAGGS